MWYFGLWLPNPVCDAIQRNLHSYHLVDVHEELITRHLCNELNHEYLEWVSYFDAISIGDF